MLTLQVVAKPIGRYRRLLAGGFDPAEHLYGTSEVYAVRWHSLIDPMLPGFRSMVRQFQVLIAAHGELTWINTDPENFIPC